MLEFLGRGMYLMRNLTYFMVYIGYGLYNIALGPIIPYLAQEAHKVQTDYSFLFGGRTLGMFVGAALFQKYQTQHSRPYFHKVLAFSCFAIVTLNFLFIGSKSLFYQGLWNFLISIFYFIVEILIDLSIIALNQHVDQLFLLSTASFGLGALSGPILIRIFGINSYFIFGIVMGLVIPVILYLPSPQSTSESKQNVAEEQRPTINQFTENLLSIAMFIYLGMLITKLGWSSSVAVMGSNLTNQQATIFPSIYSVFNIISKFVWIFMPLKGGKRLKFVTIILPIGSFLSLAIAKVGDITISLYFDCIIMAIFMSPLSALITSISSDFGMPLTQRQAIKIATYGIIGQGLLTMFCGQLINFNVDAYFYFSLGIYLAFWLVTRSILAELTTDQRQDYQIELMAIERVKS